MNQKFTLAVICASNQNRSMAAHKALQERGYTVKSYGTGSAVRLPGPSINKPNVYAFGTPYDAIYHDLVHKDEKLLVLINARYNQLGLLKMLDRNRKIKQAPEKFQDNYENFQLVVTCEERCFDAVCEEILLRGGEDHLPTHVINIEIRDNHEDAEIGASLIVELVDLLNQSPDYEHQMQEQIKDFVNRTKCNVLHTTLFY